MRRLLERNATASAPALKPTIGFAASLLAVWCQVLLLATVSLAPLTIGGDRAENIPICHADDGTQPGQQKPEPPAHDCAQCVLCLSHTTALAVLSAVPTRPERRSATI